MDVISRELTSAIRRPPGRLLLVGDPAPGLDLSPQERVEVARLDEVPVGSPPFDLILWRPSSSWNERLLRCAAGLLKERGRLWIRCAAVLRRRLVLDLGRLGFAVLEERTLAGEHVVEARHDGFEVRGYQEGDEEDILRLFTPCFHVERSAEHWRWKYRENPWARELITVAHSHEGELAAHYAGYPVPFYSAEHGEVMTALQIGDTMTDPRFRRAGRGVSSLLGRCFRHFFASHCDGKVAFNYGFNTGNIRRFNFQFIKGRLAQEVAYWRRGVEPPAGAGYRATRIETAGASFDRFFRRVAPHYGFLVRRDARWLSWRYLACPDAPPFALFEARRRGRLVAWAVFRRRGEQLLFVDALVAPGHTQAAADLLRAALRDPELSGASEIVAWFPPWPEWWHREVEALGFERAPEPNDLALIYLPFTRPEVEEHLPRCYYTLGDGDLA